MQALINGLANGGVLAMSAIAFSLVSGTTKGLHLAHGAVMTAGGLIALATSLLFNVHPVVPLICAVTASTAIGLVIEVTIYRPLSARAASRTVLLLASLGTYLVIAGGLAIIFGYGALYNRQTLSVVTVQGQSISTMQALQFLGGLTVLIAALLLLKYSSVGKLLRAQTDDPELLDVLGGRTAVLRLTASACGSALAGAAGALLALDLGMDVNYGLGASVTAAVASMLAGPALSVKPALAGFGIGVLEAQASSFVLTKWSSSVTYGLLLLILIRRSLSQRSARPKR